MFASVLGRSADSLSMYADFFSAGGTSLQVFRALALLQDALKLSSVPATVVHTGRTAHGVTAELLELQSAGGDVGSDLATPIAPRDWSDSIRPLSANQEQMWSIFAQDPTSTAYNMPFTLSLRGNLDVSSLKQAFSSLLNRHEVLRYV